LQKAFHVNHLPTVSTLITFATNLITNGTYRQDTTIIDFRHNDTSSHVPSALLLAYTQKSSISTIRINRVKKKKMAHRTLKELESIVLH
jgi:hypothetical protein